MKTSPELFTVTKNMQNISKITNFRQAENSSLIFVCSFVLLTLLAALAIGSFPLQASIVTIFLFAGLHNFFEFRYFAARMPLRWGKSKLYYSTGIGGVILLTSIYLTIYFSSGWLWNYETWAIAAASWNTAFILWVALLIYLRGRQRPQADWSWAFAAAFLLAALAWLVPQYWALALVYLHPFVAMYFLERQIRRTRKEWLTAYRICLATIPFFIVGLWFAFAGTPDLTEENRLFSVITNHAGANILPNISSHFLVAAHVFLETIHYSVWIILIPLVDKKAIPWKFREIPLFASEKGFPKLVAAGFLISFGLLIALWAGFSADYVVTRDIYFAFAIAHVLAEFPFLVKML
jgi:hypothetical protein